MSPKVGLAATISRGDLLITPPAYPFADHIVQASRERELFFYPDFVHQLLEFLECVVLYDRVVIGTCQIESPFAEQVLAGDVLGRYAVGRKFISEHVPVAQLADPIYEQLKETGVLAEQTIDLPGVGARDYFEKQLSSSATLRRRVDDLDVSLTAEERNPELRRELAILITWENVGRPLYIAEAARVAEVSHHLSWWEAKQVEPLDREDRQVFKATVARLAGRVNAAAQAELERIQSLGGRTPFPETPIAWQIISNASNRKNLADVALQLRDEYADFRRYVQGLESELRSDDVTLSRKGKILNELDQVVMQLWPAQRRGLRRELIDTVSIVGALPAQVPLNIPSVASLVATLVAMPVDALLRASRYRRYRVLFQGKRQFMRARGSVQNLARVFALPLSIVQQGFDRKKRH